MNTHGLAIAQPTKMLKNMLSWLDQATAFAKEKDFDADRFLELRIAVDQFALVRQIQSACDSAKFIGSRLTNSEAPKNEDNEKTMAEVRSRLESTIAFLEGLDAAALDGWEERKIELSFLPEGKWVRGEDYLSEFALPNMYFHVTTSYAILRHYGVPVGKRDFIGAFPLQDG